MQIDWFAHCFLYAVRPDYLLTYAFTSFPLWCLASSGARGARVRTWHMSGQCVRCGDIWPFKGPDFRPVTVVWQTLQQDDNDNDDDDGDDDDDNNNNYNNNNMARTHTNARTHAHARTHARLMHPIGYLWRKYDFLSPFFPVRFTLFRVFQI